MRRSGLEAPGSNRESFVAKADRERPRRVCAHERVLDEIHAVTQIKSPATFSDATKPLV